ncbi:hypothetical protein [Lacrimispora sp.]|uniref:hypothetical protein n=1 Tax=Lacrimispora sp. TaxID=2719234 RepID=UPI0028B168E9|nr:hypothetical protein [Lacrimispora sp.]
MVKAAVETEGKKVIEAARRQEQGTVILEADKQVNALTESFHVFVKSNHHGG